MRIPLSKRLLACAQMVAPGSCVADVGTDHGYLAIWLLKNGGAAHVIACDLREQPLASARANAVRFSTEGIEFRLSDGLAKIAPGEVNTVVCAGMGGDLIAMILDAAPWLRDARYTLILQPQSAGQALRQYLSVHGFAIDREALAQDGHFLYTVLRARKGTMPPLTPGQQYASPQLLREGGALLPKYLARIENALAGTVQGLQKADEPEKLRYYQTALAEIKEMRKQYDDCP